MKIIPTGIFADKLLERGDLEALKGFEVEESEFRPLVDEAAISHPKETLEYREQWAGYCIRTRNTVAKTVSDEIGHDATREVNLYAQKIEAQARGFLALKTKLDELCEKESATLDFLEHNLSDHLRSVRDEIREQAEVGMIRAMQAEQKASAERTGFWLKFCLLWESSQKRQKKQMAWNLAWKIAVLVILLGLLIETSFGQGTGPIRDSLILRAQDEGITLAGSTRPSGLWVINCTGSALTCSWSNSTSTLTVNGTGGSPLTTKGDLFTFTTVDARLPVGANGLCLTADSVQATGLLWASCGASHNLLSATHSDTTAAAVTRGGLVVGQTVTPKWQLLTIGGANTFLGSDGTDASWTVASGTGAPVGTGRTISTTSPITGGGNLSADRTLACATCGVTGNPLSQFAATTSAQFFGVISDETGGTLVVGSASPTLTGTVTIDRRLEFTEAIGDPACVAGDFWISVTSTTNVLRKCENGTLSNLDTGGGGGASTADAFVTVGHPADLTAERNLAGTASEIVVTDGGANNDITLSLDTTVAQTDLSKTFTSQQTFNTNATLFQGPEAAIRIALENPNNPADDSFADSPQIQLTGIRDSLAGAGITRQEINWKVYADVTLVAGTSQLVFQSRIGAAGFIERMKVTDLGVLDVQTGFRISGAAATNNVLVGNSNEFVSTATAGTGPPLGTGRQIIGGAGVAPMGDLSADRIVLVGQGSGITVNADDIDWGGALTKATTITSDAIGETIVEDYQAAFSSNGQHIIKQSTGNPTAGALFRIELADTDPVGEQIAFTNNTTTQATALSILRTGPSAAGANDGNYFLSQGASNDGAAHTTDWRQWVDVTSNAGASTYTLESRIDAAAFAARMTLTDAGKAGADIFNATTGFRIGDAAATGALLKGNGTNFVSLGIGGTNTFLGSNGTDASWTATTPSGAVLGTGRTLTGGAGIGAIGDLSADRTIATDSTETDFLAVSALTCGAGTKGRLTIPSQNLTFCDNQVTPVLQTATNQSRTISTTSPITGGGDLSADRTLGCATCGVTGSPLSQFASTTSLQFAGVISDETGTLSVVLSDSPVFTTQITSPVVKSAAADPADAGAIRLGNAEVIGWEASPTGTDLTLTMDANNVLTSSVPINATTGFRIGNAAATNNVLAGNGTNFVSTVTSGTGAPVGTGRLISTGTGLTGGGDFSADRTHAFDFSQTLAGSPALNAKECVFTTEGASGGGFLCEGTVANTNEQLHLFAAIDGLDSTDFIATASAAVTDAIGATTTNTLTNKTLDVEGTGNSITTVEKLWIPAAVCINAVAANNWDDDPAVAEPTAACVAGTNITKGVADFLDAATSAFQTHIKLPADWTGALDAKFVWLTTVTTNNVVWQIATICVADAETDDPAFNAASTVTDAAKGVANQLNDATITGVTTTGCAAGELMHVRILRDPANVSDTLGATARLVGVELTTRRAQ